MEPTSFIIALLMIDSLLLVYILYKILSSPTKKEYDELKEENIRLKKMIQDKTK